MDESEQLEHVDVLVIASYMQVNAYVGNDAFAGVTVVNIDCLPQVKRSKNFVSDLCMIQQLY